MVETAGEGLEEERNNSGREAETVLGPCLCNYVDQGSTESHRYYLSRRTALEMLKDRGYEVAVSEIDLSLEEFRAVHGQNPDVERLRFSVHHRSDPSKRVKWVLSRILFRFFLDFFF